MEDITEKNLIQTLINHFPDFELYFKQYISEWDWEEEDGLLVPLMCFSQYVEDLIKTDKLDMVKTIFNYIELLLSNANLAIQNLIATVFLEHLENSSFEDKKIKAALNLLGEESKAYLKAWDEFWEGSS